jgi:hypothetical protein
MKKHFKKQLTPLFSLFFSPSPQTFFFSFNR